MLHQSVLCRLIVVGCHEQQTVRAEFFSLLAHHDRVSSIVRACPGDDRDPSADDIDYEFYDFEMLIILECRGFAGRPDVPVHSVTYTSTEPRAIRSFSCLYVVLSGIAIFLLYVRIGSRTDRTMLIPKSRVFRQLYISRRHMSTRAPAKRMTSRNGSPPLTGISIPDQLTDLTEYIRSLPARPVHRY